MIRQRDIHEALKILEIEKPIHEVDEKLINKQYKRLARKYHPDINKDDNAEEMFKKINEAKEVALKIITQIKNGHSFNDPFAAFRDMFSFNMAKQRIAPIQLSINLDLKEQYYGGDKEVTFKRRIVCKVCNGKGCDVCGGKGFEIKDEKIKINLQPGLNEHGKLVYQNIGHEYVFESSKGNMIITGDLIIQLYFDKEWIKDNDTHFERQGNDLIIKKSMRYIDFLEKYHTKELDSFEVSLFDNNDTVVFTKDDPKVTNFMIMKSNLGFKSDYRSRVRDGNLVLVFDIDFKLDQNDVTRLQDLITKVDKENLWNCMK